MRKIDLSNFRVATSETARDINRRVVLNLIRARQPISRADLARCSGLQRSTVSLIAEQLISERWVLEGPVGRLPRGRRPVYLRLSGDRAIIGIDIRPIQTTLGVAALDGQFLSLETIPTGTDPDDFLPRLVARVCKLREAHAGYSVEGIGVSLPGRVDSATCRLAFAPNLGWRDVDLKTPLADATGLPVELENAANACALAEIWFGQDPNLTGDLIVVTVSEGIGTGIYANGQILSGSSGMAGEFGHVSFDPEGPPCRCGKRGCWEVYGSNSAAIRYYSGNAAAHRGNAARANSGDPTFTDILALAEQCDPRACQALDKMADHLGHGIAMLLTGFAPAAIIVVGELTRAWSRMGPRIERVALERRAGNVPKTRIVPADLASQPRLRGTIALFLQKHLGVPGVI